MSHDMVAPFTTKQYRAIGKYAEVNDLVPQLSLAAERIVHFRARKTQEEVLVPMSEVLAEFVKMEGKQNG